MALWLPVLLALMVAGAESRGAVPPDRAGRPRPASARSGDRAAGESARPTTLGVPIVYTRVAKGAQPAEGGRIVLRAPDGAERVLTAGFERAADPEVAFDARHILFAGKRAAGDPWNIFEMDTQGGGVRQITRGLGNCRHPVHLPRIFYLDDPAPLAQVAFVSDEAGTLNLYSIKPDGTGLRRLTYNLWSSYDPAVLPDGRVLFTTRQGAREDLFGVNLDGTDYAAFSGPQGLRVKHMAAVTADRKVVFVEAGSGAADGAGSLGLIDLRRNLKSYKPLTTPARGLFTSPAPLPDGSVLVARRTAASAYGIYRFDPRTGALAALFRLPDAQAVQPRALVERTPPDGRASVVDEKEPAAKLYCLSVYESDLGRTLFAPGLVKRLRVLEALAPPAARFLGEIDVDADGSFQIEVPANIPIRLQALDENGMSLRESSPIWAKNKENRGCIGCHEDGERTPENVMAKALTHPAAKLTLEPARRRTVTYADVAPIVAAKCTSCHSTPEVFKAVTPGRARTSPLVWHIYGRNTSRPWDKSAAAPAVTGGPQLTDEEKRTIVEWIDLGAQGHQPLADARGSVLGGGARRTQ